MRDVTPRRVWYLFPDEPLVCVHGHTIEQDFWILGDTMHLMGGARCDFIEPVERHGGRPLSPKEARQYRCGRCVYFITLPGHYTIVADVSPTELHTMHKERMTPTRIREFLGLDFRAHRAR